ncbi:MAG: OsmC family protein [Nitrososphaerales archaeon]|nr:OsmC family protein [Nitrososphaerales archaeon]
MSWAGGYTFLGSDLSGHTVVYDSDVPAPKGISPMRALLTSLGACSGMDVVAILRKRNQNLASLKVRLSGVRPEHGYPKPWQSIAVRYLLTGDLEKRFVEEAIEESMAKFCSVAATLRPGVEITYSYQLVR